MLLNRTVLTASTVVRLSILVHAWSAPSIHDELTIYAVTFVQRGHRTSVGVSNGIRAELAAQHKCHSSLAYK